MDNNTIDLLSFVESGGCSAKIAPGVLKGLLSTLKQLTSDRLLVGNDKNDDALVYKLNDHSAMIQTTDFFPPVCSDPYTFGQIAAANALSDVFAMGGTAVTALNIVMFPSAVVDISVLQEILVGGAETIAESGALLAGGHTIDGPIPVYGVSATGIVHPQKIITNDQAQVEDQLVLTKGIGTGTLSAAHRIGEIEPTVYKKALTSMKQLNKAGAEIMQKFNIRAATDITGFSLVGHALEMAQGSNVCCRINGSAIPLLAGAYGAMDFGCIPGAAFRNLSFVEDRVSFSKSLDYNIKMLSVDAQTSGGLLMCAKKSVVNELVEELQSVGYEHSAIIGEVTPLKNKNYIEVV